VTRTLIYLLSFGPRVYAEMTALCIRSLRGAGRYTGDIAVLTDGSFVPRDRGDAGVRAIDVGAVGDPFAIKCLKTAAALWLDPRDYDRAVVMDTDMIAVGDVAPLLAGDDDRVRGMEEEPFNTMLAESCGGGLLALDERAAASRRWGINTGFLCTSGRAFAAMLARWRHAIGAQRELANYWADQPYFNRLVLRGELDFVAYPRGWIDMPPMYRWFRGDYAAHPDTRILHLCGNDKHTNVAQMRAGVAASQAGLPIGEVGARVHAARSWRALARDAVRTFARRIR
jgi:hypothetical protein